MAKIRIMFLNFFRCCQFFQTEFLDHYELPTVLRASGYPIGWKENLCSDLCFCIIRKNFKFFKICSPSCLKELIFS